MTNRTRLVVAQLKEIKKETNKKEVIDIAIQLIKDSEKNGKYLDDDNW